MWWACRSVEFLLANSLLTVTLTVIWATNMKTSIPRGLLFFGGANQSLLTHGLETGEMYVTFLLPGLPIWKRHPGAVVMPNPRMCFGPRLWPAECMFFYRIVSQITYIAKYLAEMLSCRLTKLCCSLTTSHLEISTSIIFLPLFHPFPFHLHLHEDL